MGSPVQVGLPQLLRSLFSPLGMCPQIEVGLSRMNASNAVDLRCAVKNTHVIGHDEPDIRAAVLLAEEQRIKQRGRWFFDEIEGGGSKV